MAEDVTHINLTDPASEQVYCHLLGEVVKFDGPFVAGTCWGCPYWTGLAKGYGVECTYDDPNASSNPVKYSKATAAQAEAPEAPEDPETVASQAGIAALRSREQLPTSGEEEETEEPAEEVPAEEEPAEEEAPVPAEEPAAEEPKKKPQFTPKQKAEYGDKCPGCGMPLKNGKCPGCGSDPDKCKCGKKSKSATAADVVTELSKQVQFRRK